MKKLIIIIVILVVALIAMVSLTVAIPFGNRVVVTGIVTYKPGIAGYLGGWSISEVSYEVKPGIFSIKPMWFGIGETDDINVKITLGNKKSDVWIKPVSSIIGGRRDFEVTLRGFEEGSYTGTIYVYEVERGIFGIGEEGRSLKTQQSIQVNV